MSGPKAMPASLPPNSAYTYAAEFSVDEAVAAGATEVRFSQALPVYVENYLGFPVGVAVPMGYYDPQKAQWIASDNGRVIKVLSITAGLADLDIDGTAAANAAALTALGVTDQERTRIALLYPAGQTLWRMPITHFTTWDANWGWEPDCNPAAQSCQPSQSPPRADVPVDTQSEQCGSVIGCENQTLGESVPVNGTPWQLHYKSDRAPGRKSAYTLNIPLSGATLPTTLKSIELVISVAGRQFIQSFPAAINQRTTFTWDGRDGYGRMLQGSQPISVRLGYTYGLVYANTGRFGSNGNGTLISAVLIPREATLWQQYDTHIGAWDNRSLGLGGWSLNIQHAYDPTARTLLLGDGRQRRAEAMGAIITTVAGNGGGLQRRWRIGNGSATI